MGVRFLYIKHYTSIMEKATISKQEFEQLKKKAEIADDAIVQLKLSLEDLKHKRVNKWCPKDFRNS